MMVESIKMTSIEVTLMVLSVAFMLEFQEIIKA